MEYVMLILIILVVLTLLISLYAFFEAFYFSKKRIEIPFSLPNEAQYDSKREFMSSLIKDVKQRPYESVYITSHDGLKLFGRYYHIDDNAPIHIQFHGYKGSGLRDMCGGNKITHLANHNSLMVDQRSHGLSEGTIITFGIKERYDCLKWIEYVNQRFGNDKQIVLSGVSMGAATVLMASNLDLPSNVKCIIADCPYSSPKEIIMKFTKDRKLPPKILYPFIYLGALLFAKLKIDKNITAVEAVKNSKVPILLIHGTADELVPHTMSEDIKKANPDMVQLELFENAHHGLCYILDPDRYINISNEFLNNVLNKEKNA